MKISIGSPVVLVFSLLGIGACRAVTDGASAPQQIQLDLHSLVGGTTAPPDFVSVLDTARLTIVSGGIQTSQALPLGQSDSTVTFDVAVTSGSVRFGLDVISNNLTPLYRADTSLTVDADDFAVQITPEAVNGVMVIWPRNPPSARIFLSDRAVTVAQWLLRNAGLNALRWNVDSLATTGVLSCTSRPRLENCFASQTLEPSSVPDTVLVVFDGFQPAERIIRFASTVGEATFAPVLIVPGAID